MELGALLNLFLHFMIPFTNDAMNIDAPNALIQQSSLTTADATDVAEE